MSTLMYHDIVAAGAEKTSGFPGRDAARYKVTPEAFVAHLDAIACGCGTPKGAPYEGSPCDKEVPFEVSPCDQWVPDEDDGKDPPRRPYMGLHVWHRFIGAIPPTITFDDGGKSGMAAAEMLE